MDDQDEESDPPNLLRLQRLGGERPGEEGASYGDDERPSVHKSLCLAAYREGRGGAVSGTTLHQRAGRMDDVFS